MVVEPPKPHVDPSVLAECGTVVNIPERDLVPDETNRLWAKDRATLGDCRRKDHAKAVTIKALTS
ncbi:MAG: hypothetical protein E5W76_17215 [Mesorhizobium sp.]|nr:MAG: hypothetical protein E5W76_17215 [Mesorhizobium sp.]